MATWTVLWDFDDTLASRPGLWSGCLVEVLDRHEPGHGLTRADLVPLLQAGFPWHEPDVPHPHLNEPRAWWSRLGALCQQVLISTGIETQRAALLAGCVRERYLDRSAWKVQVTAREALALVVAHGGRNVILSNHLPELVTLVSDLGLSEHVHAVISSARIGYEKPHPEAFRTALAAAGRPEQVWMIGDSLTADIAGAAHIGIPGILLDSRHAAGAGAAGGPVNVPTAATPLEAVRLLLS